MERCECCGHEISGKPEYLDIGLGRASGVIFLGPFCKNCYMAKFKKEFDDMPKHQAREYTLDVMATYDELL